MRWLFEEVKLESLAAEISACQLGDERLSERAGDIIEMIGRDPHGFIVSSGCSAAVAGFYRFMINPRFDRRELALPHLQATARRVDLTQGAFLLSDTTDVRIKVPKEVEDMGTLYSRTDQGFRYHSVMAVSRQPPHLPLGTLAMSFLTRGLDHEDDDVDDVDVDKPRPVWDRYDRESQRWYATIERAVARLETRDSPNHVHLMDAEGDYYELLGQLHQASQHFVVRSTQDRRVEVDGRQLSLYDGCQDAGWQLGRVVEISRRDNSALGPKARRLHPSRQARTARLQVRAQTVKLLRPDTAPRWLPERLELSLIELVECDPPEGEAPVHWRLLSSLPIETAEQIEVVVEAYLVRWLYEEQVKTLKTGCGLRQRRFSHAQGWQLWWVLACVLAWRLLVLRVAARDEELGNQLPIESIVDLQTLALIESLPRCQPALRRHGRTARAVVWAIAALGGHQPCNGAPGWLTLRRGLTKLYVMLEGYLIGIEAARLADDPPRAPPPSEHM